MGPARLAGAAAAGAGAGVDTLAFRRPRGPVVSQDHPVWEVYNALRSVRMNVKYYRCKLRRATNWNFRIEFVLAASSSSAVGGLWLASTWEGGILWKGLVSVAALLSVYQLVAKPSDRIRSIEQRVRTYGAFDHELTTLRWHIARQHTYGREEQQWLDRIMDRLEAFRESYVDPDSDGKLLDQCEVEVRRELPAGSFLIPGAPNAREEAGAAETSPALPSANPETAADSTSHPRARQDRAEGFTRSELAGTEAALADKGEVKPLDPKPRAL